MKELSTTTIKPDSSKRTVGDRSKAYVKTNKNNIL
jgi:hypothetical protein